MGKILGIIAEYNPFHNGHFYHLEKSKKITNYDYTIAIMSGNFTQRGSTSIIDKWEKTKIALSNGIDLVIELPTLYAISSAENFADGSIKILNSLGIVNYLSFGSECPDIKILDKIADVLYIEPDNYKLLLSQELKKGLSFPKARENALSLYCKDTSFSNILNCPNNILAIEYLKALKKYKSSITPICIERFKTEHSSTEFSKSFASSTAIRNLINNKKFDIIKNLVPSSSYSIIMENIKKGSFISDLNIFEKEIIYLIRKMNIEDIRNLPDVSEGLEFSIKKASNLCNNISDFFNIVKSKRYTYTRIQRILLYALLGITKSDIEVSKNTTPYIRVLGFNDNGKNLISSISKTNPNIITSVNKFVNCNKNPDLDLILSKDIFASNVYNIGFKSNYENNLDFKNGVIKL